MQGTRNPADRWRSGECAQRAACPGLAALPVGETVATAALVFGIMSLGTGFVNLLPFRTGSGLITDGARLIPLLRETPEANRDVALATVCAEAYRISGLARAGVASTPWKRCHARRG